MSLREKFIEKYVEKSGEDIKKSFDQLIKNMVILENNMICIQQNQIEQEVYLKELAKALKINQKVIDDEIKKRK